MGDELAHYFASRLGRRLAGSIGRLLDRLIPRRADRVVALSAAMAEHLHNAGVCRDRLAVIPPGVFAARSRDDLAPAACPSEKLVVYAGNLDRYQNLPTLLQAMVEVCRIEPAARLVIVTHEAGDRIEEAARDLGLSGRLSVVVAEDFSAVRPLLRQAQVLVCPRASWSGFPIKLLNYMQAGKPIVVSAGAAQALGPGPWLVVRDHDAGALAEALAAALRWPGLGRSLGGAAQKLTREVYDWPRVAARIERLYADVLEAPRGVGRNAAESGKVLQKAAG
jgi:glycosyltransferase involved in cell wall biosynthesis